MGGMGGMGGMGAMGGLGAMGANNPMAQMAQMMAQMSAQMMAASGAGGAGGFSDNDVSVQLQTFIQMNNLDDSCQGWLRGLSISQQKAVMDQGMTINVDPSRGSANSVVMGRIKKAKQGTLGPPAGGAGGGANAQAMAAMNPMMAMMAQMAQNMGAMGGMGGLPGTGLPGPPGAPGGAGGASGGTEKLRKFIEVNRLDASCSQRLMALTNLEADWVMDQGFVIGSDPQRGTDSAACMGRIKKVKSADVQQELQYYPHTDAMRRRLDTFVQINQLDSDCEAVLRDLSHDLLTSVMGDDFLLNVNTSVGSASAVVMGRIKRARVGDAGRGPPSKMARTDGGRYR